MWKDWSPQTKGRRCQAGRKGRTICHPPDTQTRVQDNSGCERPLFVRPQLLMVFTFLKGLKRKGDFPGGPVVKNPPCHAGDAGSIPGQGTKIPHASGATKPMRHNYWARAPQLESPHAANYKALALEHACHNYRGRAPWSSCTTAREEKTCTPQLERSLRTRTKIPRPPTKDPACLSKDPACRN